MKRTALTLIAAFLAAAVSASVPASASAAEPRPVRTVRAGDVPMLDDTSLAMLAGVEPRQALAAARASEQATSGFWRESSNISRASLRGFKALSDADLARRLAALKATRTFFVPVALVTPGVSHERGVVQLPLDIDSKRWNLAENSSAVCSANGRECVMVANVGLTDPRARANVERPLLALRDRTTLTRNDAAPVFGLIIETTGDVQVQPDGRRIIPAVAKRAGFIDITQCVRATACGVALEFDVGASQ